MGRGRRAVSASRGRRLRLRVELGAAHAPLGCDGWCGRSSLPLPYRIAGVAGRERALEALAFAGDAV